MLAEQPASHSQHICTPAAGTMHKQIGAEGVVVTGSTSARERLMTAA